jgi:hypothetical protein
MTCSSAPAYRSAAVEGLLDLLAAVRQLEGRDHLAGGIIDQSQACRFAAWVQFEAERLNL